MGKFVVKRSDDGGFMFNLIASNGRIICTSQSYASLSSAKNGIESIRKNVGSEIENQASKDYEAKKNPKWEIYADKAGEFGFRLYASNGKPIISSQGYKALANAKKKGIRSIRRNAPDAEIVENFGRSPGLNPAQTAYPLHRPERMASIRVSLRKNACILGYF